MKCKDVVCTAEANGPRGFCSVHYRRWLRDGGLGRLCAVPDCEGGAWAKGLCSPHHSRASRYGLSVADLVLVDAETECAVCGGPPEVVDHDHETGRVRGVLCGRCNRALGLFGDSVPNLLLAALYLSRSGA